MELKQAAGDPRFAVKVALGDPNPKLVPQKRGAGLQKDRIFRIDATRYLLKKAKFAMDDFRVFDAKGQLVCNSHHPGKNPLDALDPLGMANTDAMFNVAGGEWEALCDVSAHSGGVSDFSVRPRTITMHGRQLVKTPSGETLFNVAKVGKLKARSLRPQFAVCRGGTRKDIVYRVVFDLMGRTAAFYNEKKQLVAVMTKTKKALILNALLGAGSESTIDIAPGVDCSVILASIFALLQCGASVIGDAFNNFVREPLQDAAVDQAVDAAFGGDENEQDDEEPPAYDEQEPPADDEEANLEEVDLEEDIPEVVEGEDDDEGILGFLECFGNALCAGGEGEGEVEAEEYDEGAGGEGDGEVEAEECDEGAGSEGEGEVEAEEYDEGAEEE